MVRLNKGKEIIIIKEFPFKKTTTNNNKKTIFWSLKFHFALFKM